MIALLAAGLAALAAIGPASAQQAPAAEQAAAPAEQGAAEPLSAEALDALVAPVALYPDPLLAQVLVAATYPLDIVKAARWVGQNETLADDARAGSAEAEGWDPSIAVLAAAFPSVVERMAEDLDATEALGDAVLVDTDAVLDAIQRQRERAAAVGNLESNAAQSVTVEGDTITIAPADPQVVYVPAYDPATVYTQPAPSAPVVVEDPDEDYDSGDLLATGIIAFGAGLIVSEIFDNDDDWGGYWGAPAFGWGAGAVYPRPIRGGINVDGDVTISRDSNRVRVDRDDAWRPEDRRRDEARDRVANRGGAPRGRDAARPETRERDAARERITARTEGGGAAGQARDRAAPARPAPREIARPATREAAPRAAGVQRERAQAPQRAASQRAAPQRQSAFDRGGHRAAAASNRGARSAAGGGGGRAGGGGGGRAGGGGARGR